jgi:CRP/FNR family cyclic AMP-dependent transcriptional regulator
MTSFDSAWFLYGALVLLLATSFVVRIDYVRIGLAAAALVALPLGIVSWSRRRQPAGARHSRRQHRHIGSPVAARGTNVRFSAEEEELRRQHFSSLGAVVARGLIDQGHWISAKRGEMLIRESQAAPSLFYLAEGNATILRDGLEVGKLSNGALIGEATVLDGTHATGTVLLGSNARLWFVPAAGLRAYLAANPGIAGTLHEGFARALRGKLASANTRLADRAPIS